MGQRSGANSATFKKSSCFIFEEIYKNNIADKSQIKYLKYILGVNKHTILFFFQKQIISPCIFLLYSQLLNIYID